MHFAHIKVYYLRILTIAIPILYFSALYCVQLLIIVNLLNYEGFRIFFQMHLKQYCVYHFLVQTQQKYYIAFQY